MSPGLLEAVVTVSAWLSFAGPALIPDKLTVCDPESWLMVMFASEFRVGGSLTGLTVTVKERLNVLLTAWPSFTVTVMVAVPLALAAGVKLKLPVAFGLEYDTAG